MTGKKKKVDFSVRPRGVKDELPPSPEQWVRDGKGPDSGPQKRLTLNIPAGLHTAFKSQCVIKRETIQEKVIELIEQDLSSNRLPMEPEQGLDPQEM
jgi:hypothetical protein